MEIFLNQEYIISEEINERFPTLKNISILNNVNILIIIIISMILPFFLNVYVI